MYAEPHLHAHAHAHAPHDLTQRLPTPHPQNVAGAWDVDLMEEWAVALGKEFRAKGANMILGPSINVHRVALNGQ